MTLLLLLALMSSDGGTPHPTTLVWPGVTVTQMNDDGTTFTRPVLGYYVRRALTVSGVRGDWVLLNPDAVVVGMAEDDGTPDPGWYEDETPQQGATYVYAVTAVDFGGESGLAVSGPVMVPVNPNTPSDLVIVGWRVASRGANGN